MASENGHHTCDRLYRRDADRAADQGLGGIGYPYDDIDDV